ncbi:MAG: hypothetical protein R2744_13640 [Bacteroidales bacterium]
MIEVTCAVIRNDDNMVLAVRREMTATIPLSQNFGKREEGESLEECIVKLMRSSRSIL